MEIFTVSSQWDFLAESYLAMNLRASREWLEKMSLIVFWWKRKQLFIYSKVSFHKRILYNLVIWSLMGAYDKFGCANFAY